MSRELTYPEYAAILAHRVLARHASFESCEECEFIPCRHCGTYGPRGEDHTCSCPFSDADCEAHR